MKTLVSCFVWPIVLVSFLSFVAGLVKIGVALDQPGGTASVGLLMVASGWCGGLVALTALMILGIYLKVHGLSR